MLLMSLAVCVCESVCLKALEQWLLPPRVELLAIATLLSPGNCHKKKLVFQSDSQIATASTAHSRSGSITYIGCNYCLPECIQQTAEQSQHVCQQGVISWTDQRMSAVTTALAYKFENRCS